MPVRTKGISPKVIADAIVSVLAFLFANGVVQLDAGTAALLAKALGSVAAIVAGPGIVTAHADDIGAPFRDDG